MLPRSESTEFDLHGWVFQQTVEGAARAEALARAPDAGTGVGVSMGAADGRAGGRGRASRGGTHCRDGNEEKKLECNP